MQIEQSVTHTKVEHTVSVLKQRGAQDMLLEEIAGHAAVHIRYLAGLYKRLPAAMRYEHDAVIAPGVSVALLATCYWMARAIDKDVAA